MKMWKWIGLAGVVGAAAIGVAAGTVTVQRKRREYVEANPSELRDRLHARFEEAQTRQAS